MTVSSRSIVGFGMVLAVGLLVGPARGRAATPERPREIYAHYMGCYPAAARATGWHRENDPKRMRHTGRRQFDAFGDRWRNWPLMPATQRRITPEASADLEIRRAIRAGLDGFAVDAWAGGDDARETLSALFEAAEAGGYDFSLTICLDPNTGGGRRPDQVAETINWMLERHGDSPNLARRDGRVLIFGYMSQGSSVNYAVSRMSEEGLLEGVQRPFRAPEVRLSETGVRYMGQALYHVAELIDEPLYVHFCMGGFAHGVQADRPASEYMVEAARVLAGEVDAVGMFLPMGRLTASIAEAVVDVGQAEWSQPLFYQYENIGWGGNRIARGFDFLRGLWHDARERDSTLIQFITWNDYTENTQLAPAYDTRYAVMDLNRHFIDWWKTGEQPVYDHDKLYLSYRKYPKGVTIFPFQRKQPDGPAVLEVVTILTAPATIRLPGRDAEWEAPAGMSHQQFDLTVGEVIAEIIRDGEVVLRVESPEPVTERPFREQNSMVAFSSEFERHWRADFGDDEPLYLHGEYADADGDGLPNWFEMYWFGEFLEWETATVARADEDTNGDGITNLEHYLAQTDPTRIVPPELPDSLEVEAPPEGLGDLLDLLEE